MSDSFYHPSQRGPRTIGEPVQWQISVMGKSKTDSEFPLKHTAYLLAPFNARQQDLITLSKEMLIKTAPTVIHDWSTLTITPLIK